MGFSDMVTKVQQLVGNHSLATTAEIGKIVNSEHRELVESYEWSRKKIAIILSTVLDKAAGTVTLTNGSANVVGVGTAWAATDTGKSLLVGNHLFVFNYLTATTGTLSDMRGSAVTFQSDTITAQGYVLFKRWYSLGIGIESILSVKEQYPIRERSQEWLDSWDQYRSGTAASPLFFARGPWDQSTINDLVQIEFSQRPSASIDIEVLVLRGHTDLSGTQNPIAPAPVVQWRAAEVACYYLHAKTKEPKWMVNAEKYQKKGAEALEFEKNADAKHFGRSSAIKDVGGGVPLAMTDFAVTHDVGG